MSQEKQGGASSEIATAPIRTLRIIKRPQPKVLAFRTAAKSSGPERPDPPTNTGHMVSRRLTSMLPVNQDKFVVQVRAALRKACERYQIELWAGERWLIDDLRAREIRRTAQADRRAA